MNFRQRLVWVVAGLILLGFMGTAGGAELPVYDLPQLIKMALKFSPEVKASKSEVDQAQGQQDEARGYYYPRMEFNIMGGVVPDARLPQIRNNQIYYPDPSNKLHGVGIFGRLDALISQPLYTFGKIAYRERAAEKYVKVKEAGVEAKKGEVMVRMAEAYYGLILAEQGRQAVKEARTYTDDTRRRITKLLAIRSTTVTEADMYRLVSYESALDKFAAQAEEGAKVAYKALKELVGAGPGQEFRVPEELPTPEPAKGGVDFYIQQALDLRPEFTQLKEGLVARELLVKAAKADRLPSFYLAVQAALAGAPDRKTNRDPYIYDFFNQAYAFPFVGAKWHFDFGISKAKIKQAQAELEQLQHTQKTAFMGIPIQVARAYGKVQENYKGALAMEKAYINARRWIITSFGNFDMGLGKMEEIFQAIEKYATFRGDYLLALFNYNVAVAELDNATGAYRRTLANLASETPERQNQGAGAPPPK